MADNNDKKPTKPKEPEKRNYPPDTGTEKRGGNIRIPSHPNPPQPPPQKDNPKK